MPTLSFNIFELMPRSADHYVLPALGLPVIYKNDEIARTDVSKDGDFSIDASADLSKDLNFGDAIILPNSAVASANGEMRLELISIHVHALADTLK
jgi:hypothetical protein